MGRVMVLQTFPLLLRLRVGNRCCLAQPAPFRRGFLFIHGPVRKKSPLSVWVSLPAVNVRQKELYLVDPK